MSPTEQPDLFHDPLQSLERLLSHFDHQGVIIGGIAVSLLGQARFTEDLDAMLLLSVEEIPHFLAIAHKEGLVVNQKVNDKERNYARQTESPSSIHD